MAGDNNQTVYSLDLDTKQFTTNAGKALQTFNQFDNSAGKTSQSWTSAMASIAKGAGILGAAALASKVALDAAFQGEALEKMNYQFDLLARRAGVAGSEIKKGFMEAAEGELSAREGIQVMNQAIIKLGENAKEIPRIMRIAKQASEITGESATQAFENISSAVAAGNARMLRQYGIYVDQKKAVDDYAKSLGVAAGALTDIDKRQAIMNAALKQGEKNFSGTAIETDVATKAFERLKASFSDLADTFRSLVATQGPALASFFDALTSRARTAAAMIRDVFNLKPADTEEAGYRINELKLKIMDLEEQAEKSRKQTGVVDPMFTAQIEKRKAELAAIEAQFKELEKKEQAPAGPDEGLAREAQENAARRMEQNEQIRSKFERQEIEGQRRILEARMARAQSEAEVDRLNEEMRLQIQQEFLMRRNDLLMQKDMSDEQRRQMEILLEQQKNEQLIALDGQLFDQKRAALDRYLEAAQTTAQGFTRAFQVASQKAALDMKQGIQLGQAAVQAFSTNATQALLDFGAGAKDAGEALKGFMFGAIADTAQAYGQQMLLASIFPPNPVGLAAGAGLIALAGMLRSKAKGSSDMGSAGAGGGGGGEAVMSAGSLEMAEKPERKEASIVIQGNYFDTDQTRQRLTDMIRESGDYTDFKVKAVGLGGGV